MAVQGVLANRLRSLLTMLGITIGVAAVIILVAVGHGSPSPSSSRSRASARTCSRSRPAASASAAAAAASQLVHAPDDEGREGAPDKSVAPDIKSVTPVVNGRSVTATRRRRDRVAGPVRRHDALVRRGAQVVGRRPARSSRRQDERAHARVVVIGQTVVQNLFGSTDPLGQTIQLNGVELPGRGRAHVEGLERHPGPGRHRDRPAHDRSGRCWSATSGQLSQIVIEATSSKTVNDADAEATSILTPNHSNSDGSAAFRILNQSSLLQTTSAIEPHLHGAARRRRRDLAARRRDRRDEHHARHGHRAHARDRHPQGDRRAPQRHPRPVPDRGGAALDRRRARSASRRASSAAASRSSASSPSSRPTRSCSPSASASPSASSSASTPPTAPPRSGRSRPFATSRRTP